MPGIPKRESAVTAASNDYYSLNLIGMAYRRFLFLLILITLGSVFRLFAQDLKKFSDEPEAFIAELTTYMKPAGDRESKDALQQFVASWSTGTWSPALQKEMIGIFNRMLSQRMRPTPGFRDYLLALISFPDGTGESSVLAWHKGLEPFVDSKALRQLSGFLDNTVELNRRKVLFKSYANSWQFRNGSYRFAFDSVLSVVLEGVDLVCISGRDSIRIHETSGIHFPLADRFAGHGGKVYWEAFGFDPLKVYALISKYEINLKQTAWSADSVNFYHKDFFNFPLTGTFEDRVLIGVSSDRATFPRFVSYQTDIEIRQVFKDMNYRGGFTLEGPRIIGSGYGDKDAAIWINRKGSPFMKLTSRNFVIRPDRIASQRAAATIYHESDSIFHPGIQLRYIDENKEILLLRSDEGASASPFFNSYHRVDMYFEALYYPLGADSMNFEMLRGIKQTGDAVFESSNYYSEARYHRLQGIDELNPINVIYNYTDERKTRTFYLTELTEYMQKPVEQVKAMVINLSNAGYIIYNLDNERIEVSERLFDYLNARSKKTDYDVIQISSQVTRTSNAVLNLNTFDLRIKGVSQVSISDSQAVYIYPRDKEILLRKNRDFVFTGLVRAGYFDFYANKSSFEYDKFKLSMPQIDSISFKVDTLSKQTKRIDQVVVKNVLANLSGELLIDDPQNKSGIAKFPAYPVFISENDAFVYYDQYRVEKGVYKRDKFYYTVYPFTLDSLNSFTTEGLKFEGHLYSGGIFPDIREPLRVMSDFSLGFTRVLPDAGLPVYEGKANFFNNIRLSNKGLEGKGVLDFMTSTSASDRFMFYPDSLVADLKSFVIKEQSGPPAFPAVTAEKVHQYWLPYLDVMRLNTISDKDFFTMYNEKSLHSGILSLTSAGLLGKGQSRLDNADIGSGTFVFSNQSFTTDTTDFRLYYPERPSLSLMAKVYPGKVDFRAKSASFGTQGKSVRIALPLSKYICYMDKIQWRMDVEELYLTNSLASRSLLADTVNLKQLVDFDFSGSEFMSTDPARDSLQFFAMEATYRMKENIINAREVKMIRVADVAVFPGDGKVTILSDGDMKPLTGATIIANRKHKYHRIYDASVSLKSRRDYAASGFLDYTDDAGGVQPLYFKEIFVGDDGHSKGRSTVKADDGFTLSAFFDFIGQIDFKAQEEFLTFTGAYHLRNECLDDKGAWVSFSAPVDPAEVRLPVSPVMRDTIGDPVYAAIVYSDFFGSVYPAMFRKPKAWGDTLVASASGFVKYDRDMEAYLIGSVNRLDKKEKNGNLLSIDTRQCIVTAEGSIEPGAGLGQVVMKTFGKAVHYSIADSTRFALGIALDFFFSDPALDRLKDNLQKSELPALDVNSGIYQELLNGLLGSGQAAEVVNELNLSGQLRRPPAELVKTLLLADVNLVWDPRLKSYISEGPIGIAGIQRDMINRKVNGYLEIGKRRTGDILNLYIEISNTEWYFFTYGNGIMQAISSNNDFNNIIAGIKEDKRTLKGSQEEEGYQFIISTPDRRIAFLRKMQSREAGF